MLFLRKEEEANVLSRHDPIFPKTSLYQYIKKKTHERFSRHLLEYYFSKALELTDQLGIEPTLPVHTRARVTVLQIRIDEHTRFSLDSGSALARTRAPILDKLLGLGELFKNVTGQILNERIVTG